MIRKWIEQVLRGEIDPALAAERASRFGGPPGQTVRGLDLDLVELARQGDVDHEALVRLGRFNHELSLRLGEEPLLAQTAFTLSQLLLGEPASSEESARLVELAVPILEREPRPRPLMGRIYQHAASSLFQAAGFLNTPERKQRMIGYGLRAIELLEGLPDTSPEDLWELHHSVGTKLNELDDATQEDLARSVEQLEQALAFARRLGSKEKIGSTLNNLGNALRLLGASTADGAILRRAIRVLEDALPYRTHPRALGLTRGNLQAVRRALEALAAGASAPRDVEDTGGTAGAQIAAGEKYLKSLAGDQEAADTDTSELLARGVEALCAALAELSPGEGELLRARGEMGLGIALNRGRSSTEAALGVCFYQAARRRFEHLGERQRGAAACYNLGQAFSTILDRGQRASYLETAARHFEAAQRGFEELGASDQARQSLLMRAGCFQLMAEAGDALALERSRELFRTAGISNQAAPSGKPAVAPGMKARLRRLLARIFKAPSSR